MDTGWELHQWSPQREASFNTERFWLIGFAQVCKVRILDLQL